MGFNFEAILINGLEGGVIQIIKLVEPMTSRRMINTRNYENMKLTRLELVTFNTQSWVTNLYSKQTVYFIRIAMKPESQIAAISKNNFLIF